MTVPPGSGHGPGSTPGREVDVWAPARVVVVASGGTPVDGEIDFATPHIRQVLAFLGIREVEFVVADRLMADEALALERAHGQIERLAA